MSQRMETVYFNPCYKYRYVLVYLIWNHLEKKEKSFEYLSDEGCSYACPLVGPACFLSYLFYKLVMSQNMDLSGCGFWQGNQGFHQAG